MPPLLQAAQRFATDTLEALAVLAARRRDRDARRVWQRARDADADSAARQLPCATLVPPAPPDGEEVDTLERAAGKAATDSGAGGGEPGGGADATAASNDGDSGGGGSALDVRWGVSARARRAREHEAALRVGARLAAMRECVV